MKTMGILILCAGLAANVAAATTQEEVSTDFLRNNPLALVLSGGGAKGAYEVGVWQELEAAGLAPRVKAISGTSVGAINAALFAARPEAAETLWLENMNDVFAINTNRVGETIQKTLDTAAESVKVAEETGKKWKGVVHFVLSTALRVAGDAVDVTATPEEREGYIDSSNLAAALEANLPSVWPAEALAVYATAVEKNAGKASATWKLNGEPHERRVLALRASAAIPLGFDTVEIDGKTYVDGGWESKGGDNVPLGPILENHPDIQTVIVVYLDDERHLPMARVEKNRKAAEAAGVRLVEIIPSENIGGAFDGWQGVFDASPETARHLIDLGRSDANKALREAELTK